MHDAQIVIAAVGLPFEGRIAAGPGVRVLGRGAKGGRIASIEAAIRDGCQGIISFGIAGGLAPHLRAGTWIVGSAILDHVGQWPTCPQWSAKLIQALPGAIHAVIAGSDAPVAHPAVKRLWHEKTGAVAVDMESHLVARIAAENRVAFAALRVVADPAHRAVPTAALAGMRDDGSSDILGVLRSLAARPSTMPALIRTAFDAATARATLVRCRRTLGPSFGLRDTAVTLPLPAAAPAWPELPELRPVESQTV